MKSAKAIRPEVTSEPLVSMVSSPMPESAFPRTDLVAAWDPLPPSRSLSSAFTGVLCSDLESVPVGIQDRKQGRVIQLRL